MVSCEAKQRFQIEAVIAAAREVKIAAAAAAGGPSSSLSLSLSLSPLLFHSQVSTSTFMTREDWITWT
jgi:hypothetical protein